MIFFIRKSTLEKLQNKNDSFEKIKAEIIAHLRKIENKENNLNKAIKALEEDEKSISHFEKSVNGEWIEKAGYGVGTVRVWRGKKYKKISTKPNRWVRVYDKTSRGAKNAITRLIHKAEKIESPEEMMQFVLLNKQRFMDSNGKPLDIVDRLQKVIDAKNTEYDSKISNEKKKYKKLQEELKEEIASGKRNNTKELQEDVDEWKNLLAVATKNPNSPYSKEQAEHFKEIIKIGEEELNRRNKKMTKKKTETKNKDVITERIDVKDFQKKIEEEKYLNKLLSYKIEDVRKLDNKDLLNTIAAKTYNYRKGDMGAAIKNANTWAEKGRLEILAKFFDDKEAQKKIDKAENDEEINYSLNKIKKSKTIGEKINNFGGLIQYLENILNFEPMFTLLSFDKKPTFDLSATKVNKINELLNSYGDKKIEQNVKSVLNELKAYNGREFTVDELLGKESEIEEHNNRSEAMKGNQNAKKDFKDLASIIKNKASLNLENDNIGEVNLTYDVNKSDLKHIIERRYSELKNKYHVEGENERRKLLTSFVFSLLQTIKHGSATLQKDGRSYILKHNGISVIARQNKAGKIVVTGFVDNSNEKEGAETIAAVNADYGYTPEFLELYAQVGATLPTNNDTMNKENVNKKRADNETPKTLLDIGKTYTGKDIVNTTTTDKNQKIAVAKAEEIKDDGKEIVFKATPQLTKFVEQLNKYSSKELNRYFMTGLGVRDGFLWATDARRLMRLKVDGLDGLKGNDFKVNSNTVNGSIADCYKCEIKDDQIILTQFDGTFPNGERVIPKYTGENKAEINNKVLLEKLKSMEKDGAVGKGDEYKAIALEVKGGKCFVDGTEIGTCSGLNDGHICFNYQYLQDALKNADTSTICFDSEKPDSRAVAISTNISDQVIMPMSPDEFPNYAQRRQEKAEENKEKERKAKAKAESNINYFNSVKEDYKERMPGAIKNKISNIKNVADEALLNVIKVKDINIEDLAKNKKVDFHSKKFLEKFGNYRFENFVMNYLAMQDKDFANAVESEIKRRGLSLNGGKDSNSINNKNSTLDYVKKSVEILKKCKSI